MSRGFFVVGTDTGVGKTTFAVGLAAALRLDGHRVAVMKPCETGGGDDAERLIHATARELPPALVRPYRFRLPAAPEVAARREHRRVDLAVIERAYRRLTGDADWTIVEGAGGLLVPITARRTMADLIVRLRLPIVVIARTRLGTMNHTLLTVEVARRRGLRVLGVAFSRTDRRPGPEESDTISTILRHGRVRSLGLLPFLPDSVRRSPDRLAAMVRKHIAVGELLSAAARSVK